MKRFWINMSEINTGHICRALGAVLNFSSISKYCAVPITCAFLFLLNLFKCNIYLILITINLMPFLFMLYFIQIYLIDYNSLQTNLGNRLHGNNILINTLRHINNTLIILQGKHDTHYHTGTSPWHKYRFTRKNPCLICVKSAWENCSQHRDYAWHCSLQDTAAKETFTAVSPLRCPIGSTAASTLCKVDVKWMCVLCKVVVSTNNSRLSQNWGVEMWGGWGGGGYCDPKLFRPHTLTDRL